MSKDLIPSSFEIENRIFTFREVQVMVDFHLAQLYQVETKRLNEQVKRNSARFPKSFMFQLNVAEWEHLQSQIATAKTTSNLRSQIATAKRRTPPYAFTEQGVAMLSAILNSDTAIEASIIIIDAFVNMRKQLLQNGLLFNRLDKVEQKQLETDQKFEQVFKALESRDAIPTQGVFFDGQVFDAYLLASKIIRSAKKSLVLIDNYIDESVLVQLGKKNKNVAVSILTKTISKQMALDVKKANEQYPTIKIIEFKQSHDRFLIIDEQDVYHLGASLKDLGKKWFAFSKLDKSSVSILNLILELI